jgi:effector-binding domain-containing protein
MPHEIEVRHLSRTPTLTIHAEIAPAEIQATMGASFGALFGYAGRNGVQPAGVFARYHAFEPKVVMDIGVTLPRALPGEGNIEAGEIAECDAAVTLHVGPYEGMAPAYEAVQAWIAAKGRTAAGPPMEFYLSPPDVPPDQIKTEVVFPLA